jgi:hypothetical protein
VNAICIDPARVHEIWPKVSPLIFVAMKRGGLGSFKVVEKETLNGNYLLWLAMDGNKLFGAAITSLEKTEWNKSCVIVACGGQDVANWIGCIDKIQDYAKAEGCDRVLIYGRQGWEHMLPSYRPKRVVLERAL